MSAKDIGPVDHSSQVGTWGLSIRGTGRINSGVDVNSEVPERSRKNFEMTFLMISGKFLVSSSTKF